MRSMGELDDGQGIPQRDQGSRPRQSEAPEQIEEHTARQKVEQRGSRLEGEWRLGPEAIDRCEERLSGRQVG